MGYDTKMLKELAVNAIKEHHILFIEDVCAFIGIDKGTFYNHFPVSLNDFYEIRAMLMSNKAQVKSEIRAKWRTSDNITAQMALFKLCSTPEEHKLLQQNYVDTNITEQHTHTIVELPAKEMSIDLDKVNSLLDVID